jgi:hypothetical protein
MRVLERLGMKEGDAIEHPMLSKSVERAQREGRGAQLPDAQDRARVRRGDGAPAADVLRPASAGARGPQRPGAAARRSSSGRSATRPTGSSTPTIRRSASPSTPSRGSSARSIPIASAAASSTRSRRPSWPRAAARGKAEHHHDAGRVHAQRGQRGSPWISTPRA